ncbi:MAG: glycosyl hydrolase [Bacteroidetes bacterium]|nr:glycosyl hydrolase [Bacteroidota bacterium]
MRFFFLLLLLNLWLVEASAQQKPAFALNQMTVYTTADSTEYRLQKTAVGALEPFGQPFETQPCIFVDPDRKFQTFIGIGGAITDASAEVFAQLPADKQAEVLERYYDPEKGIGYKIARTNMNSCDFSSASYTYVKEGDTKLKTFDVAPDLKYKIPLIKLAMAKSKGKMKLFISPWSPPGWMKDNQEMLHGGKLKPEYYQAWANYYVKFIQAYQKQGVPIWGLTVQNEPMAKQTWESCIYTAEEERDFIKKYLGPSLWKAGLQQKRLIAWDHNRDLMYQRASTILQDPQAAKYVWGIGFHWYEDWTGGGKIFENVKRVGEAFPDKHLIFTEGCADSYRAENIHDWKFGETYGRSMINDFNNGTAAWTDWNILLDEKGGPNHVGNFCFAPVHADTRTGVITYLSSYYYIGHFSKFIQAGARRVSCASSRGQLLCTAFQNPDGSVAVVVMNATKEKIEYRVWVAGKAAVLVSLPHSIQTILLTK